MGGTALEATAFSVEDLQRIGELRCHLLKQGYVWIKAFFTPEEVRLLNAAIDEIERRIREGASDDTDLRIARTRQNYAQLSGSSVTMVDIRGQEANYDGGMIDIFKPRVWLSKHYPCLDGILDRLKAPALAGLIASVDCKLQPCHSNIYIHNEVRNPRVPHVDANRDFFKIFSALTDHGAPGAGPLLVYPGSHRRRLLNRAMCFYNARFKKLSGALNVDDATFYDRRKMVPLLMKPGDIALCNQSIVHSAMPALPGGYRRTFVQVFDIPRGQQ
jgi:hypothetical protein